MISSLKEKITALLSNKNFLEILTGSAWAVGARVIAVVIGLIASIIIARRYGAEMMGIVTVIDSFLLLSTVLAVMGTNTSILRLIPEHMVKYSPSSAYKVYCKTQLLVIVSSVFFSVLFFFFSDQISSKIFNKSHLSFYFGIASTFLVFKSLTILNTQAIRGLKLIRVFSMMLIFPQGFNLILLFLIGIFISSRNVPIYALLGSLVITGMIGWVIMEFFFKKRKQPSDMIHPTSLKYILVISLPMLMTAAMTLIINQTGILMLSMFRSDAEVGYYGVAAKMANLTTFILTAINSMAAPKFSELFHSRKIEELFNIAKKSTKLIFYATTPILIGLVIFGKIFLGLAFGKEFTIAYSPLLFLVVGQFVNSISGSTGYFMNMTGNEKVLKNIMLFTAIANIMLNFLLIPNFGVVGVSIAAMTSLIVWNVIALVFIKLRFGTTTSYFPGLTILSRLIR